jgi:hypothetical protein
MKQGTADYQQSIITPYACSLPRTTKTVGRRVKVCGALLYRYTCFLATGTYHSADRETELCKRILRNTYSLPTEKYAVVSLNTRANRLF